MAGKKLYMVKPQADAAKWAPVRKLYTNGQKELVSLLSKILIKKTIQDEKSNALSKV